MNTKTIERITTIDCNCGSDMFWVEFVGPHYEADCVRCGRVFYSSRMSASEARDEAMQRVMS